MSDCFIRTALFRTNQPLSCAKLASVDGFEIEGTQPINTDRRIVFTFDDASVLNAKYFKLVSTNGVAQEVEVCKNGLNAAKVLAEGNSIAELEQITKIPNWIGKNIYPIIALSAPESQNAVPTLNIGIKTTPLTPQYEKYEESPIYELADTNIIVIGIDNPVISKIGNGSATVQVRFKNGSTWSNYTDIKNISNIKANAVQFRINYSVNTLGGTNSVKVDKISMVYATEEAKISGTNTELVLITKHFGNDDSKKGLSFAQCLICHDALKDADIKAFIAFRDETKRRIDFKIGIGNGSKQTISLADSNIVYNSFSLKVNGTHYSDFSLNTENNEVTLKVDSGSIITATYNYDWSAEVWQKMSKISYQKYGNGDKYASIFQFASSENDIGKTVSAIKFALNRTDGFVENEVLGTATGDLQSFELPHYARADTIICSGVWNYDEETKTIKIEQTEGEPITISYYWLAESPVVHSLECGWARSL